MADYVYDYHLTLKVKVNVDSESDGNTAIAGLKTELTNRAEAWLTANNDSSDTVASISDLLYHHDP